MSIHDAKRQLVLLKLHVLTKLKFMANEITIRIKAEMMLPDNEQWENRFEIPSSSSNRMYTISQNKAKRHWGCSCMGWKRHRHCTHLDNIGLPGDLKPYEPKFVTV